MMRLAACCRGCVRGHYESAGCRRDPRIRRLVLSPLDAEMRQRIRRDFWGSPLMYCSAGHDWPLRLSELVLFCASDLGMWTILKIRTIEESATYVVSTSVPGSTPTRFRQV